MGFMLPMRPVERWFARRRNPIRYLPCFSTAPSANVIYWLSGRERIMPNHEGDDSHGLDKERAAEGGEYHGRN